MDQDDDVQVGLFLVEICGLVGVLWIDGAPYPVTPEQAVLMTVGISDDTTHN